ncbi:MAG: hypothetical protein AVDCRST_MAG49-1727, partial [uncultured Thermomicrobiales bacterium]
DRRRVGVRRAVRGGRAPRCPAARPVPPRGLRRAAAGRPRRGAAASAPRPAALRGRLPAGPAVAGHRLR